jgi:transcription initiation factor TFIIF subunit alpha
MSRPLKRIPIPEPKRRRPPPPTQASVQPQAGGTPATSDTPFGAFVDYKLVSSKHTDKKWDVFKLQSHRDTPIELDAWPAPVKLNHKDFKSRPELEKQAGLIIPMLGQDGKPVFGPDGKIVMVNADGSRVKKEAGKNRGKEDPKNKKKAFTKKLKQVHAIPDEVRAFRQDHRKDWLLEDNGGGLAATESWSGRYSDVNDKNIWAFFAPVPGNDLEFRFIPAHRFYNFTKNKTLSAERIESEVSNYPFHLVACLQIFIQHARMQAVKANIKAKVKKEEEEEKPMRAGRRLKLVNRGNDMYGDDESKPRLVSL